VTTPTVTAATGDVDAVLRIVRPAGRDEPIRLKFNPTEFQITKNNTFAEIPIPGLQAPLLQYVRGGSEMLSVEALVDTSDTLLDVRAESVAPISELMRPDPKEHAPPIVVLSWGSTVFQGVLENLGITYLLFTPAGIPLRARLSLSLKQYYEAKEQAKSPPLLSPTVEKSYVVRRGDSWQSIANAMYRDPDRWRELARANGVVDPRMLEPGRLLRVPRLG
jgi:nucleoid-associated protein YgaU